MTEIQMANNKRAPYLPSLLINIHYYCQLFPRPRRDRRRVTSLNLVLLPEGWGVMWGQEGCTKDNPGFTKSKSV